MDETRNWGYWFYDLRRKALTKDEEIQVDLIKSENYSGNLF